MITHTDESLNHYKLEEISRSAITITTPLWFQLIINGTLEASYKQLEPALMAAKDAARDNSQQVVLGLRLGTQLLVLWENKHQRQDQETKL